MSVGKIILYFLSLPILLIPIGLYAQTSSLTPAEKAVRKAADFEKMSRVPVPDRPFLFLNDQEIEDARVRTAKEEWAKQIK